MPHSLTCHSERSEESRRNRGHASAEKVTGWLARLRPHFAPLPMNGVQKAIAGVPAGDEAHAASPSAAGDVGAHPRFRASRSFERSTHAAQRLAPVFGMTRP